MPHHPVVFEGIFAHARGPRKLEAEGLINGQVVATALRQPWWRRQELSVQVDLAGAPLVADGSDFVPVVARMTDKDGEVIRLTDDTIRFTVEGPAELIGGDAARINPQMLSWGEAVILVRAGTRPGTVTVRAESLHPGAHKPLAGKVSFETVAAAQPLRFSEERKAGDVTTQADHDELTMTELKRKVALLSAELSELKVAEVEKQQEDFM
jgi:beta-galactosidase